ncbi:chitobiase/beta-hexosaminidase C-terminal domain-containing protein [Pedococcus sp. KACC 23699]|uniref:Chitobiase/beta-hexosaminidase C-terminal domain-containing protein n=1 Tax=Pedococcus sp. KACC 23699 TaxID=3149228 RepID=A0AAU7JNR8_9MICO
MSRTSRRTGLGGLVAALMLLGLAVPAWAYFSVSSWAATAAGRAATLGTPGVATSGVTASTVTFTVSAPTGGPTPTGYRVARTAPATVATVCTVSGANGTCTDTAPVSGQTNTYAVYAVLSGTSWESPTAATTSVAVPSADTTAPVTTASQSPAPNGAGWNTGNVVVTLTATDASGVAGTWYTTDGSAPTTSSTSYTGAFTLSAGATVRYFSRDAIGNTETPKSFVVQIDNTFPTAAVTSPVASSVNGGSFSVGGTASDTGSGLAALQVQYQAPGASTWSPVGAPTASGGSWSTAWATAGLPDGNYGLRVLATDVAGNQTTSATVTIALKNTFTVTAPASATAGTPFTVTLQTYPRYTGTMTVSVTGLQSSPNGTPATVPTTASFMNGSATLSMTAVRPGSQTVVVTTTGSPFTNASATASNPTVVAASNTVSTLTWTSPSGGKTNTCTAASCTIALGPGVGNGTANATITAYDLYGNIAASSATVTVTATNNNAGGSTSTATYVLSAGTAAWTFSEPSPVDKKFVISLGTIQSIPLFVTR